MNDKNALLHKLTIDRNPSSDDGRPMLAMAAAVAVGAILSSALWWFITDSPPPPAETDAPAGVQPSLGAAQAPALAAPVETDAAAEDNRVLDASGYITARRMATVSAEITGRLTEVLVEEGMEVAEGQIVARLDDALAQVDLRLARAQVTAVEATLAGLKSDLEEARRVLRRTAELAKQENASEAALTRAQAQVDSLAAQVAGATANLEIGRLEVRRRAELVDDHLVRAPFAGVVVDKRAQPGEIVSPISAGGGFTRTGICTLVDMSSLEIEVDVNESFIGRVFAGQGVEATLDAYPDWRIPASVIAIVPTANRQKATVKVRIGIDAPDPRILPDMGVKVAFLRE